MMKTGIKFQEPLLVMINKIPLLVASQVPVDSMLVVTLLPQALRMVSMLQVDSILQLVDSVVQLMELSLVELQMVDSMVQLMELSLILLEEMAQTLPEEMAQTLPEEMAQTSIILLEAKILLEDHKPEEDSKLEPQEEIQMVEAELELVLEVMVQLPVEVEAELVLEVMVQLPVEVETEQLTLEVTQAQEVVTVQLLEEVETALTQAQDLAQELEQEVDPTMELDHHPQMDLEPQVETQAQQDHQVETHHLQMDLIQTSKVDHLQMDLEPQVETQMIQTSKVDHPQMDLELQADQPQEDPQVETQMIQTSKADHQQMDLEPQLDHQEEIQMIQTSRADQPQVDMMELIQMEPQEVDTIHSCKHSNLSEMHSQQLLNSLLKMQSIWFLTNSETKDLILPQEDLLLVMVHPLLDHKTVHPLLDHQLVMVHPLLDHLLVLMAHKMVSQKNSNNCLEMQ
jgi:hypothetical protein